MIDLCHNARDNRKVKKNGFSFVEVLISISLFALMVSIIIPSYVQFRERQKIWAIETDLNEEAIRFFTYFQNRNASVVSWGVQGSSVVIDTYEYRGSSQIRRWFYQNGNVIAERDLEMGGYLILSFNVRDVQFYPEGDILHIELTLEKEGIIKTYQGILPRSIDIS